MADISIGLGSFAETDVASAATCDIGAVSSIKVRITGSVTITSFGAGTNRLRFIRFAAALTLTHNAVSLRLPTNASIAVEAGDTCFAMSTAAGNWVVVQYQRDTGLPLSRAIDFQTSIVPNFQVWEGAFTSAVGVGRYSTAAAASPRLAFLRTRGTSPTDFAIVQSGDRICEILFCGSDGTGGKAAAAVRVEVDGAPAASDMPGRIVFMTTPDGSTTLTERLRIDSVGHLQMGGANTVVDANRHHQLRSYTVAGVPSAATAGQMIYISNETGGAVPAFSDGTNWRRVTDRTIVS